MVLKTGKIHLVIGPVGAGKSTFVFDLQTKYAAVPLCLDDWMAELFNADRPATGNIEWYLERTGRCIEQIWKVTERILEAGADVVLEIGLIQRVNRQAFYERIESADYPLTLYVIDAPRGIRRERVEKRNQRKGETFSMHVPPSIFEMASDLWQSPDEEECQGRDVHFIGASD